MDFKTQLTQDDYESKSIWSVLLSNNEIIYSDDLYINEDSDWIRLKKYCESNKLYIKLLKLQFRDRTIHIKESSKYFFRRMQFCSLSNGSNKSYFIVGYKDNNGIYISKYMIPELEIWESEYRNENDCQESLINGSVSV